MNKLSTLRRSLLLAALQLPLAAQQGGGAASATVPTSIVPNSIEDLMNVQVTSVSRREQSLSDVGAAVFVLTAEDIRRSGATNIPDLLRLVPGVEVAQIDAHSWAISIRGFNDLYANKVLVLIDGRSVYTPLTSGVNWDQQDVPLEDIDRIEVIRGPAGTVWGANAVNGVISITTKKATPGEGGVVRGGASSRGNADGLAQYGGAAGTVGAYRLFADYSNTMSLPASSAIPSDDDWHSLHEGGRLDLALAPRDSLTVQGDLQRMEGSDTFATGSQFRTTLDAANALAHWDRTLDNGSEISLQVYYDHYNRISQNAGEIRNTLDVDFHHHLTAGLRHDIVWGLGYRITADRTTPGVITSYNPASQTANLFTAFLQDEIRLSNALALTLGSKIEHNFYTGFEYEPGAQLVSHAAPKQQIWLSAAQAIRQPSRSDTGVEVQVYSIPQPSGGTATEEYLGTPNQPSEKSLTYEIGYRNELSRKISLDAALFYSSIHNLATLIQGNPFFAAGNPDELVIPYYYRDAALGRTYGGELYGTWTASSRWKLSAGYSVIHIAVPGQSPFVGSTAASTPRGQFQLRNLFSMKHNIEWDTSLFEVSALGSPGIGEIPAYLRLDTRLGRHFGEFFDISVVGQNLLQPAHQEFGDWDGRLQTLMARSVYARLTWRF
jgi:iron complex outermembrane receptor protein